MDILSAIEAGNTTAILFALFTYLFFRMEQMRKELSTIHGKVTVICYYLFDGEEDERKEKEHPRMGFS